ncbi:asparaginase [Kineococcus gynurae]|uniref:asparaginase n=1 Tax=Kineococcus gynurae TaxID=452979 RepID=A0ABV5LVT1_9ACTN
MPETVVGGVTGGDGRVAGTRLVVVTTGGTIASTVDEHGVSSPTLTGSDLLGGTARQVGVEVEVREALRVDSATLTLADADRIHRTVRDALADATVHGVVVLHGTDSLEETAYLLDLLHEDPRPVVLTGSQRTADHADSDAPANVRTAFLAAADPASRGRGVLVAFGGYVLAAAGVTKRHTTALDTFGTPDGALPRPGVLPDAAGPWPRVDVVALTPGDDGRLLDACLGLAPDGLVLVGLGSGNASPAVVASVARATAAGVPVVLTTRVPAGPTASSYGGGGGGHDLVAAGGVPAGRLRVAQARVLLAVLLRGGSRAEDLRAEFARRG